MKIFSLALAVTVSLFSCSSSAEDWHGRVSVLVDGDADIAGDVNSYIKRELRGLNDVTVTDVAPDFSLRIIARRFVLTTGREVGYALSAVATSPFQTNLLLFVPSHASTLRPFLTNYVTLEQHWLFSGPTLRPLCADAVTQFDSICLDSDRHIHDKFDEYLRNSKLDHSAVPAAASKSFTNSP